jgi:hypothetical protein
MKRLRETSVHDPLHERARALLAAIEPLDESNDRMRRVRRAIEHTRERQRSRFRTRVPMLAAVLLFAGSTLAAAQSFGVLRAVVEHVRGPSASERVAPAKRTTRSTEPTRRGAHAIVQPVAAPMAATEVTAAAQPILHAPAAAPGSAHRARLRKQVHSQPRTADTELVRRALKALRRDGDAVLAARLLEEVHVRDPRGALAEEVMSLRVEAATARHDARARVYAQDYLTRYPQGRYRAAVERVLAER